MAKADRTPKKIAGLKLPKAIREAPAIKALLATPEGRKLLGDALIEGAAAAAAKVIAAHASNGALPDIETAKKAPRVRKPKSPAANLAPADDLAHNSPQNVLLPDDSKPVEPTERAGRTGAAD